MNIFPRSPISVISFPFACPDIRFHIFDQILDSLAETAAQDQNGQ